jgi:hypothetical protein
MKLQIRRLTFPWLGLLAALAASPAQAGSPGSADRKEALPHVCGSGPAAGEACDPTLPDDCGVRGNAAPFECVPDFRRKPTLRGTLWVIVDEDVGDNLTSGQPPAATILLEFKTEGRRFRITETFQGGDDGPVIGNWLPFGEDEIEELESSFVSQTSVEALGDVGEALKEVASAVFGGDFSHTLPVFFRAKLLRRGPTPTDEFAGLDTLGQAELFEVWVKFLDP